MGSAFSCFESGSWDHAHHAHHAYHGQPDGHQDTSQPLSHFFISSGHNSYLEGNQLTSTAGTATIELCLKHGCRVVELDVYDGDHSEPVVTHGGTLTSSVTFRDCVKAVARHAFAASPYPVILTIENHTKPPAQAQMAEILHHVLGRHLFVPEPGQLERDGAWLSPEALKHKVVIRMKVKPGTDPELSKLVYISNSSIRSFDVAAGPTAPSSHSLPDTKLPQVPEYASFAADGLFSVRSTSSSGAKRAGSAKGGQAASTSPARDAAAGERDQRAKGAKQAAGSAAAGTKPALGQAGSSVLRSFKLSDDVAAEEEALEEDLDDTLNGSSPRSASSESDKIGAGLSRPPLASVLAYTSKHLLRCYPSAWRMVNNSNPNPAAAWACGVSLAALNWQLWDKAVWVNQAFFSRYNHSGYILKPAWMRDASATGLPRPAPKTLAVTVFSALRPQGNRVGVFKDDLYVELRIVGMPGDAACQASEHQNNTGRLIVDRDFEFSVSFPELAVLLVLLKDQDSVMTDTVLGYSAIPLANLAPGAYKLPLAEPKRVGGSPNHTHMWVKLQIGWKEQQAASAAGAVAA